MKANILYLLILIIVSGCTIQKRYHKRGYHIVWNKKHKESKSDRSTEIKNSDVIFEESSTFKAQIPANESPRSEGSFSKPVPVQNSISKNYQKHPDRYEIDGSRLNHRIQNTSSEVEKIISAESAVNRTISIDTERNENQNADYLLYATSLLIALGAYGGSRLGRKKMRKLTRWSANNNMKAQFLLAGIQIPLMGMSIYGGYNLAQMGYDLSDSQLLVSSLALGVGISSIPFLPKRNEFVLPKKLQRRRIAFLAASMASSMILINVGNTIGNSDNMSYSKGVLQYVDSAIFGLENESNPNNTVYTSPHSDNVIKTSKKVESDNQKVRQMATVGLCIAAVLLFILLIGTFCAGICLAIGGVAVMTELSLWLGVLLAIGGIGITVGSVFGMRAIIQSGWCSRS